MTPGAWIGGALAGIGLLALLAAAAATLWEVVRPTSRPTTRTWTPRHPMCRCLLPGMPPAAPRWRPAASPGPRPGAGVQGQENAGNRPAGVLGGV